MFFLKQWQMCKILAGTFLCPGVKNSEQNTAQHNFHFLFTASLRPKALIVSLPPPFFTLAPACATR
jgi:hypothetical protein